MNGDVIKNVNHAKYNSLAIGDDFGDYLFSKTLESTSYYFLTIYDQTGTKVIKEIALNGVNTACGDYQTTFFYKYGSVASFDGDMYEIASPDAYFNQNSYFIKGAITGKVTTTNNNPIICTKDKNIANLLNNNPYVRIQKMITGDNDGYDTIIGAPSQPLKDGVIRESSEIGDQNLDFCNARAPRSSIGFTSNGDIIIAAIDGRQTNMSGATLREEAALMKELGCVDCFNFDGGGSTELVIATNNDFTYLNSPSETYRKVSNAILIVQPDVTVKLNCEVTSNTSCKANIQINNNDHEIIETYLVVNGETMTFEGSETTIDNLLEKVPNYVQVGVKYVVDGKECDRIFATKRVCTSEITGPAPIVRTKPTNFDVQFIETQEGFDVKVTYDDPFETMRKLYVCYDGEKKLASSKNDGKILSISSLDAKTYTFEIKYQYTLNNVKMLDETLEEKYTYTFQPKTISLSDTTVKKQGSSYTITPSLELNGCTIEELKVIVNGKEYVSNNNENIENVPMKNNDNYTIFVSYSYMVDDTKIIRNISFSNQFTGGCALGVVNVLYTLIPLALVVVMRKRYYL